MASSSSATAAANQVAVVPQSPQIELNVNDLENAATTTPTPDATAAADTTKPFTSLPATTPTQPSVAEKTLASTANLAQLLPTGTVLAFESLSSSFSNNGVCTDSVSNKYLTVLLIYFCLVSCVLLTFTDSLKGGDGKLYYGVATFKGFYVFNFTGSDEDATRTFTDLARLRIKFVDYVHAVFTAVVFLAVAFSDAGVQGCFFSGSGHNVKELLVNLPLGAAVLSSFVFLLFPTTRKGIGYTNVTHQS